MAVVLERQTVKVTPSGAALGADVTGVDLSTELTADIVRAIEAARSQHLVLRFGGQRLNDDQLMRFTSRLGVLDHAPIPAAKVKVAGEDRFVEIGAETRRYVNVVSNAIENGRAIGSFGSDEVAWHTDMSYNAEPPSGSALYALEVPPSGGDTMFANMYAAYERLDGALRARIAGRRCRHDASRNSAGELRRGFAEIDDPRQVVGASHPIIRTHPVTGRKAIYVSRRSHAYIEGLDLDESEALLDLLWRHVTQPELIWTQIWKAGDLVLWDNRCTIHRRDCFDPNARRLMHRTQIKGDVPY